MRRLFALACRASVLTAGVLVSPTRTATAQEPKSLFDAIHWTAGPTVGKLGDLAEVAVPDFCRFTDAKGAKQFLEATENPASGQEKGVILCKNVAPDTAAWFVVFTYNASGLVKDDDKASLDSNALLSKIQRGTRSGNSERRSRGWDEIEVVGWQRAPYYDEKTHNLTWSTRIRAIGQTEETINHSVRLLGRGGVMDADLVADATQAVAIASFDSILTSYDFAAGQKYSEWRSGDKVAQFGLTALIAGGAGVAALKLGLFARMWRLIIVVALAIKKAVIVVALGVAGFFKRLFGKKSKPQAAAAPK